MKKIIGLSLLLLVLSGCGGEGEKSANKDNTVNSSKKTEASSSEVSESSEEVEKLVFVTKEFEIEKEKFSIDIPEDFIPVEEEEPLPFDMENDSAEIFIDGLKKIDLESKETFKQLFIGALKEDNPEVTDESIKSATKMVGQLEADELSVDLNVEGLLGTEKMYILETPDLYIAITIVGSRSYFENQEEIDKILSSFLLVSQ